MAMKPQNKFQTRVNLIDLVKEYVQEMYPEPSPDEGQHAFLDLLQIYRTDTIRRMQGVPGDLDYLSSGLKVGVRLAGSLMQELQESNPEAMVGWYYNCTPRNMAHRFYNLLYETALELSWSILEIESQHPDLKDEFDRERTEYRERVLREIEGAERLEQTAKD